MSAVTGSELEAVQKLLEYTVDTEIKNHKDQTALDIAQAFNLLEIASLIKAYENKEENVLMVKPASSS